MHEMTRRHLEAQRPPEHRNRPRRKPAWSAEKDSGLNVGDVLAAGPRYRTALEHSGPALVIVIEIDSEPRVFKTLDTMTRADDAALDSFLATDWRARRVLEAVTDIDNLEAA